MLNVSKPTNLLLELPPDPRLERVGVANVEAPD